MRHAESPKITKSLLFVFHYPARRRDNSGAAGRNAERRTVPLYPSTFLLLYLNNSKANDNRINQFNHRPTIGLQPIKAAPEFPSTHFTYSPISILQSPAFSQSYTECAQSLTEV